MSEGEDYYYKGKPCKVVSKSVDGLWFAKSGEQLFQGLEIDFALPLMPNNVVQMPTQPVAYLPTTNEVPRVEVPVFSTSQPGLDQGTMSALAEGKINVNNCTPTALNKAMKGIGRKFAQDILQRKPEGGYVSWEQLLEINSDLPVNWEEIRKDSQTSIAFVVDS